MRDLIADNVTFERFRSFTATFRTTINIALVVRLECFDKHVSPTRLRAGMSAETAMRYSAITDTMNLTNEEAIAYLLDLHDKVRPELNDCPGKCPLESHLHTCVRPEIKTKFRQLAQEYGLNFGQMFSVLVDVYDQHPKDSAGQTPQDNSTGTAVAEEPSDTMAKLEDALTMNRDVFLSVTSWNSEVASLREQLAQSQAETRKAEETYQRELLAVMAQLRDLT